MPQGKIKKVQGRPLYGTLWHFFLDKAFCYSVEGHKKGDVHYASC